MPPDSHADYYKRGPQYQHAWEILARACDVPPSIEVFNHDLKKARETRKNLTVVMFARQVADSHRPVKGCFGEDD